MNLRAGFPFCVAPRFYSRRGWPDRLRLNAGVECVGGHYYPRGDWRSPEAAELALLLSGPDMRAGTGGAPDAILPPTHAAVFTIPEHVRAAWWSVARNATGSGGSTEGYDAFVAGLIEFLRFKRLPLPERCQFDVVASRPGQRSTHLDPAGGSLAGLDINWRAAGADPARRLVATINLGDEASYLVLLNLPPPAMKALLAGAAPGDSADSSASALCARFFASLSAYPLVQARLDPSDGLWLPDGPVVCDGDTREKREVDVVLTIRTDA